MISLDGNVLTVRGRTVTVRVLMRSGEPVAVAITKRPLNHFQAESVVRFCQQGVNRLPAEWTDKADFVRDINYQIKSAMRVAVLD